MQLASNIIRRKCLVSALFTQEKTQERLHLSLSKERKLLTDHPKKAFFTFIFTTGISCDQIAKIIKTSIRMVGALATVGKRVSRALRKHTDKVRPLNSSQKNFRTTGITSEDFWRTKGFQKTQTSANTSLRWKSGKGPLHHLGFCSYKNTKTKLSIRTQNKTFGDE